METKPLSGVKARLAKYQEELNRQKEFYQKKEIRQVSKLETEKRDIQKFISPSKACPKKTVQINHDSIGKLDSSLLLEYEHSSRSDLESSLRSLNNNENETSFSNLSHRRKVTPAEEKAATDTLSKVLEKHDDGGSKNSAEKREQTPSNSKPNKRKPFLNLRSRYLQAISRLRPNRIVPKSQTEQEEPGFKKKQRAHFKLQVQKKQDYDEIRTAWDDYEKKAADRPGLDETEDDIAEDQHIAQTEMAIANEFADYAEEVANDMTDNDSDADDDDLLKYVAEARRMRAEQERRRKLKAKEARKRKAALEEERLMREDRELLEQAKRLMMAEKGQGNEDAILELCSDSDEDDDYSDDDSDLSDDSSDDSSSDGEERQKWLEEARRLRQERLAEKRAEAEAQGHNPDQVELNESVDEETQDIEKAKRLRKAYIRERQRRANDSDADSDDDEDVDDLAHWLEQARLLREARKARLEGPSNDSDTEISAGSGAAQPKTIHTRKKRDDSDSSDEEDAARKQAWLEEACRLRAEALEKKRAKAIAQGQDPNELIETEGDKDDAAIVKAAQKMRRAYIRRRQEDSDNSNASSDSDDDDLSKWIEMARQAKEARNRNTKKGDNSDSDSSDEEDDFHKQAWLEEARRLRAEALEKKRAFAVAQGQEPNEINETEGDKDDAAIVKAAQKMRRAYIRRRQEDSDNSNASSDSDDVDLSKWIEMARQAKEARHRMTKRAHNNESDSSDNEDDAEQRAAWLAEARKLREKRLAEKKAEASAKGDGANQVVDDEGSDGDAAVVKTAQKMRRAHIRRRLEDSDVSDMESGDEDMSKWLEKARHAREQRSRKTMKGYSDDSDSSDEKDTEQRATWLAEARKLRTQRLAQKKADAVVEGKVADDIVDDEGSDMDEIIVKTAQKMRRSHIRRRQEDSDASDMESGDEGISKWLEKARKARELCGQRTRCGSDSDDSSDDEVKIDPAERAAWLEQARQFRAKTEARKKGQIEAKSDKLEATCEEVADDAEADEKELVEQAIKLERKFKRQSVRKGKKAVEKTPEDFLAEARRLKAAALAKKEAERRAELLKPQKITSIEISAMDDSFASIDEQTFQEDPRKNDWLEEARRLKAEAIAKKAFCTSQSLQDNDRPDDESEDEETVVKKAISLQRRNSTGDDDNDAMKWISQAREKLKKKKKIARKEKKHGKKKGGKKAAKAYEDDLDEESNDTDNEEDSIALERSISSLGGTKRKKNKKTKNSTDLQLSASSLQLSASSRGIVSGEEDNDDGESTTCLQQSASFMKPTKDKAKKKKKKKPKSKKGKQYYASDNESDDDGSNDDSVADLQTSASNVSKAKNESKKKSKGKSKQKLRSVDESDSTEDEAFRSESKITKGKTSYDDSDAESYNSDGRNESAANLQQSVSSPSQKKKDKKKKHKGASKKKNKMPNENESSEDEEFKSKSKKGKGKPYNDASDSEIDANDDKGADLNPKKDKRKKKKKGKAKDKSPNGSESSNDDDEEFTSKSKRKKGKKYGDESDSDSNDEDKNAGKKKHKKKKSKTSKDKKKKKRSKKNTPSNNKDDDDDDDSGSYSSYSCSTSDSNMCSSDNQDANALVSPRRKKKAVNLGKPPEAVEMAEQKDDAADHSWTNPLKGWLNMPSKRVKQIGHKLQMSVPRRTDMWRMTRTKFKIDTAPFHWMKVTGDFELSCKISGDMYHDYDKATIVIREDESKWVMTGMEYFDGHMNHTTCVTIGNTTDRSLAALPPNAGKAGIWFCMKRVGDAFECFYSFERRIWVQTRQGLLTNTPTLYVGISGASPGGEGFKANWEYFTCRSF